MKRITLTALIALIAIAACSGGDDGAENGSSSSSLATGTNSSSSFVLLSSSSLEAEVLCLQNSGACLQMPLSMCVQLVSAGAAQIVETCDISLSSSSYEPSSSSIQCSDYGNGTFIDARDNIEYKYVTICTQTWMAENLNHYTENGSMCYKGYNDDYDKCDIYGRLYNWETAKTICPEDWHLPSYDEWMALFNSVGHAGASKRLKAVDGWNDYNDRSGNGIDTYGFTALPGGTCDSDGNFNIGCFNAGSRGKWRMDYEYDSGNISCISMHGIHDDIVWCIDNKNDFFSVRCIKDLH